MSSRTLDDLGIQSNLANANADADAKPRNTCRCARGIWTPYGVPRLAEVSEPRFDSVVDEFDACLFFHSGVSFRFVWFLYPFWGRGRWCVDCGLWTVRY